jgi:hypothetical protein
LGDGSKSLPFFIAGTLTFEFKSNSYRLSLFFDKHTKMYYIPFRDLTSGNDTYEAGRAVQILNVNQPGTKIDFNCAFNLACAYNDQLYCPVIPKENILPFAIAAGEKKFP